MDSPPVLAAALDPRFRKLSFLSPAQRSEVKTVLEEKASTGGDSCTSTSPSSSSDQPPCKKKKPSVLDSLLGEEDSSDNEGGSIVEEVALYLDERPIKRKEDPIAWWRANANRFPRLAVLARRYLSIPATSTPSERVFSVAGIVVDKRRCALSAEMINALVFLHRNWQLLGLSDVGPVKPEPKLILQPQNSADDDSDDEDQPDLPQLEVVPEENTD